jgi:calcineurin-like phosphoesterase
VGTHTHIQTNDARILPRGTGFLTDAGMTGPRDSVLGVESEIIIRKFMLGFPERFEIARGDWQFNGVIFDFAANGRCKDIELINFWQPAL